VSKARYVQSFGEDFTIFAIVFVFIFVSVFASAFPAALISADVFIIAAFSAVPASAFASVE
jgi:hypothetical protein